MHPMNIGADKSLSIRANMIWNAAGSLVYMAAQWLITVLVVRLSTGYDAAGLLALGMAVSNIFSPIGYRISNKWKEEGVGAGYLAQYPLKN